MATNINHGFQSISILSTLHSSGKIEHDVSIARPLLIKHMVGGELTKIERMTLVSMVQCNLHTTRKIEGISSIDSSSHCEFCRRMMEAGKADPSLICAGCYTVSQHKSPTERHILQMVILSNVLFTVEELRAIPTTQLTRFNSDGDTVNVTMALNYIHFALAHEYSNCALWAKNINPVIQAFDLEGKPENMVFIQSSPFINKKAKRCRYADYTFTVYLTEETCQKAIENGAAPCNGRKCKDCGFSCYNRAWTIGSDIAEVYRCKNKKQFEELRRFFEGK